MSATESRMQHKLEPVNICFPCRNARLNCYTTELATTNAKESMALNIVMMSHLVVLDVSVAAPEEGHEICRDTEASP